MVKPLHKPHLILTLLLLMGLVLAACAPAAAPTTGSDAASEEDAAGPQMGGDLVIAFPASSEPASLDGHIDPYQPAWLFDSFVADPLVIQGPDGDYLPALAESWESNEDGTTWTFNLRDDVVFQDGTPFNAEAVKYNIERVLAPETQSAQMASDLGPISEVVVEDEFTVIFNYEEPWVTLLDAVRRFPIWSPTAAEEYGLEDFDKNLVGAGPFVMDEWVANDRIVFSRWEDYGGWNAIHDHEGPAYLDSVTIRFIGEEAVLGSMVASGDAHIAREVPTAYVEDYDGVEGYELITGYQAGTGLQHVINTRNAPLNILEVRQALLYATDAAAINDLVFDGLYLVQYGPLNTVHPCAWEGAADMYPHDPEQARALLEEAGYTDEDGDGIREAQGVEGVEDGAPLALTWTVLHHETIGEALQSQWREIGVDLSVEIVPGPVQLERVNNRTFDIIYERQRSPDPMILDMIWNSRWDEPGGWAWTGFADEDLDSLVSQLRTAPSIEERCAIAEEAQQIILENALMVPTLSQPLFYALDAGVEGFQLASEGNYFFIHNTYLAE